MSRFLWALVIVCLVGLAFKYPQYSLKNDVEAIQQTYQYKKHVDQIENAPYNERYMFTGMCYTTIKVASKMNYGHGSGLVDLNSLRVEPILKILSKIHMRFDNLGEEHSDYMFNSNLTYGLFKSDVAEKAAYVEWVKHPSQFSKQYYECISVFQ